MRDLVAQSQGQDARDVELLRGLAAVHLSHGGTERARQLLELARLIKADDPATLVLSARVQAELGDLGQAVILMAEAAHFGAPLPESDLAFGRALRDRLDQRVLPVSTALP